MKMIYQILNDKLSYFPENILQNKIRGIHKRKWDVDL